MTTNFRRVLEILAEHDVAHVVIGGLAVGLQGSAYRTEDVDIVYARDRENVEKLVAAIKPLKPRLRVVGEIDDLDILATVTGLGDYHAVVQYADHIVVTPGAKPTQVLSLEGLLISKRAANRLKDQLVLPELESMRELQLIDQNSEDGG